MEVGEPCQPKYYLLMVVSRCWGGAWLVAVSRLASVLASLLLTRCSGAHHASCRAGPRLSEFPASSHSDGPGAHGAAECSSCSQAGKCGTCCKIGPGLAWWPAPGLGWVANLLGLWAAAERNEKLVDCSMGLLMAACKADMTRSQPSPASKWISTNNFLGVNKIFHEARLSTSTHFLNNFPCVCFVTCVTSA